MAAKPSNIRFMSTTTGKVHVVSTKTADVKDSKCSIVKKGHEEGKWGRKKGVSADAALSMDACVKCNTHEVAKVVKSDSMTPAEKRAAAKEKSDETIMKLGNDKPKKQAKGNKEPKRRGPKQSKPETMKEKAEEHAKFAEQNGWRSSVEETASNELTVTATKNKETLKIIWQDGRTIWSRVTLASGVEVKLRNSANWRKHAAGESKIKSDYQPRTREGSKKALKSQVIDDDAPRKLPFKIDDEDDDIIKSLNGRTITWRLTMTRALDSATVPERSRNVRIATHPKSGRKMISFHELHSKETKERDEVLGPERTVYLDKILKVR